MKQSMMALLMLVLSAFSANGQEIGTIQGLIVDSETGDPLIGANVVVKAPDGVPVYGTSTNLDGKFILEAPVGRQDLEVTYISYANNGRGSLRRSPLPGGGDN